MVDHKILLAKHLALVSECEGTSYIERLRKPGHRGYGYAHGFSDEEIEELMQAQVRGQKIFGRGFNGRPGQPTPQLGA